jgi:hypothetical protein
MVGTGPRPYRGSARAYSRWDEYSGAVLPAYLAYVSSEAPGSGASGPTRLQMACAVYLTFPFHYVPASARRSAARTEPHGGHPAAAVSQGMAAGPGCGRATRPWSAG